MRFGLPASIGAILLALMFAACILTLPYTLARESSEAGGMPRYNAGSTSFALQPPAARSPPSLLGTDILGRSLLIRCLAGGGISLCVGLLAAAVSVSIGTIWGAIAGYKGGRTDAVMMRIVDVLFGLPYVLLVVLLSVASDSLIDEYVSRQRERTRWERTELRLQLTVANQPHDDPTILRAMDGKLPELKSTAAAVKAQALTAIPPRKLSEQARTTLNLAALLIAIGGVSWLTMARVIRGQVLSLKSRPFVEAARAIGASPTRIFIRHLLPNLAGTIIVYATLTIPQAILQESFLSFLGVGVQPPLPSWGNLASEGLGELNPYKSHWWLLLFPCLLLSITLLSLNLVGEGLRQMLDPRNADR